MILDLDFALAFFAPVHMPRIQKHGDVHNVASCQSIIPLESNYLMAH